MITIEIPKKELLRQLPDQAGYALLQWLDQMPETFILQGFPAQTPEEKLAILYPDIKVMLTPKQWEIFALLHDRGRCDRTALMYAAKLEDEEGFLAKSNSLDVHVNNMGRKLKKEGTKFRLINFRANGFRQGAYKLIKRP